ncbi:MAG: class I SAM-dependent methyltransferase, partial [Acidimicrobiales bacterium]
GPGRFTLALAPRVATVTAVDPSTRMLGIVRREAKRRGLANIECLPGRWQDVDVAPADILICSYVLPLVADAGAFLAKMEAARRHTAFLYLNAASIDLLLDPLWRHFHGRPRRAAPTWLDAVALLRELGLDPRFEVIELPTRSRWASVDEAVKAYVDNLLLTNTAAVRKELRQLLSAWLLPRNGKLGPPVRTTPAAIISWGEARR